MKKVYKSILAATIALSTTMSIVTGFAANNDKEKNQENNSAIMPETRLNLMYKF